jgi:hypothetical protein
MVLHNFGNSVKTIHLHTFKDALVINEVYVNHLRFRMKKYYINLRLHVDHYNLCISDTVSSPFYEARKLPE